jgi:hypothetical protein
MLTLYARSYGLTTAFQRPRWIAAISHATSPRESAVGRQTIERPRRNSSRRRLADNYWFHLEDWLAPDAVEPDDLCLWGEVLSGQRVEDGGRVTNLTADEWIRRWRDFRTRHADFDGPHGR